MFFVFPSTIDCTLFYINHPPVLEYDYNIRKTNPFNGKSVEDFRNNNE